MTTVWNRINTVLLLLVLLSLLAVIAMLASGVRGGPLDPPGTPGSTMRTLDEVSGAWNRNLSATGGCNSPRFRCEFIDNAVLDRNTGLVWMRFPISISNAFSSTVTTCASLLVGTVKGWRVPSAEELMTLVANGVTNPALPTGHPFTDPTGSFWTTTFNGTATNNQVVVVNMGTGVISTLDADSGQAGMWCVRGGNGYDGLR